MGGEPRRGDWTPRPVAPVTGMCSRWLRQVPPSLSPLALSGQVVFLQTTSTSVAPLKLLLERLALVKFALLKFAPLKLLFERLAFLRFSPTRRCGRERGRAGATEWRDGGGWRFAPGLLGSDAPDGLCVRADLARLLP